MASLVFGCIVPHPPVIVPAVGSGREREITATISALERLAEEMAKHKPETVFIISPHGVCHYDAMGVLTARSSSGNFLSWGARGLNFHFDNDLEVVTTLQNEAKAANIPLKSIGAREYELDHGVLVPLYFLSKAMQGAALVPLTFSWLPLSVHFAFGQAIGRATQKVNRHIALVASGDLSHRLLPGAPAGYDPQGKVFDRELVDAVAAWDSKRVLNLDPELIDRAGECGLRSIVILMGALEGLTVKPRVHSYEGPFGVGYLVASVEIEGTAASKGEEALKVPKEMHPLVKLAKETVGSYILSRTIPKPKEMTPEMSKRAGTFVSIKRHGELRGCIGTFEPTKANVAEEIIMNAISSATRDPRFPPIRPEELDELTYSVDVLSKPEPIDSPKQLDPRRYGVIVQSGFRRGLLLPDLEGVNTIEEQVDIACHKAGILPHEPIKLYRFEVHRYT